MDKAFDPRLESMRGIAALAVAAHHGMSAFAGGLTPHPLDWLLFAFNPAAAVMFFFVLSGYVLGRALERDSRIFPFLVRRAFRIVPPFVFAVLFAFACVTLIRIDPVPSGLTGFFMKPFWPEPTWSQLWDNLILTSSWVDGPTWSIWPELVGSAFLPFLVFVHKLVPAPNDSTTLSPHKWRWLLLFFSISVALAFSAFKLVLWFYLGFFLAKEIADGIGARKWLSVIAFVVGFVFLKVTADHCDLLQVGYGNSIGGCRGAHDRGRHCIARFHDVAGSKGAAISWADIIQLLLAALAHLLSECARRCQLPCALPVRTIRQHRNYGHLDRVRAVCCDDQLPLY